MFSRPELTNDNDVRSMLSIFGQHNMFLRIEMDATLLRSLDDILKGLNNLHHHCITTTPLHHYAVKQPHQETGSNTNIDLEEDEIQQQNTGSDVGLKWKHNLDRKKAADRLLASVLNTIEVVKISFPQGLVLISRRQLRY